MGAWIAVGLGVVVTITLIWFFERRQSQIWDAALASVTWHEEKGEWSLTYDGVKWYVETHRNRGKHEPGELGRARAFPFGYQAGVDFTLKLHRIIESVRERDVAKQWRARHGVVLEQDKSP